MTLNNVRLSITNIAPHVQDKELEVVGTGTTQERDTNNQLKVIGYTLTCSCYRGESIKVKLPLSDEIKQKLEKIQALLDSQEVSIMASFINIKLKLYAMTGSDGRVISGVSAKADDFDFEQSEPDELADVDIER